MDALMAAGVLAAAAAAGPGSAEDVNLRTTASPEGLSDSELQDPDRTLYSQMATTVLSDVGKKAVQDASNYSSDKVGLGERSVLSSSMLPPRTTSRSATRSPSPPDRSSAGSPPRPHQQHHYRHGRVFGGQFMASAVPSPTTLPPRSSHSASFSRSSTKSSSSVELILGSAPFFESPAQPPTQPPPPISLHQQAAARSVPMPGPKPGSIPVSSRPSPAHENPSGTEKSGYDDEGKVVTPETLEWTKLLSWRSRSVTPTTQPGPSPTDSAAAAAAAAAAATGHAGDSVMSTTTPIDRTNMTKSKSPHTVQAALAAAAAAKAGSGSAPGSAKKSSPLTIRPPMPPMPARPSPSSATVVVVSTPSHSAAAIEPEGCRTTGDAMHGGATKRVSGAARLAADDRAIHPGTLLAPCTITPAVAVRGGSAAGCRPLSSEVIHDAGEGTSVAVKSAPRDALHDHRALPSSSALRAPVADPPASSHAPGGPETLVGRGVGVEIARGNRSAASSTAADPSALSGRYPSSYFGVGGGESRAQPRLVDARAVPASAHEAKLASAFKKVEARIERHDEHGFRGPIAEAGRKLSAREQPEEREGNRMKEERKRRSVHERSGKPSRDEREGRVDQHRRREGSRRRPINVAEHKRDEEDFAAGKRADVNTVSAEVVARQASTASSFWSNNSEGVRLVVEFIGSVEGVARATAVCSGWRGAVQGHEDRLFKLIVRRAGVTPRRRAAFWEHMILRR